MAGRMDREVSDRLAELRTRQGMLVQKVTGGEHISFRVPKAWRQAGAGMDTAKARKLLERNPVHVDQNPPALLMEKGVCEQKLFALSSENAPPETEMTISSGRFSDLSEVSSNSYAPRSARAVLRTLEQNERLVHQLAETQYKLIKTEETLTKQRAFNIQLTGAKQRKDVVESDEGEDSESVCVEMVDNGLEETKGNNLKQEIDGLQDARIRDPSKGKTTPPQKDNKTEALGEEDESHETGHLRRPEVGSDVGERTPRPSQRTKKVKAIFVSDSDDPDSEFLYLTLSPFLPFFVPHSVPFPPVLFLHRKESHGAAD
jgi:hypothetical protein